MPAIFLDVQNELREITRELEVMQRKIERFNSAQDMEDKDSHVKAIAGCIHSIYSGMEKIQIPHKPDPGANPGEGE